MDIILDLKLIDTNYPVTQTITSVQDDTWDILSFIEYADEQYLADFIYANKYLDIKLKINGGLDINIPKIKVIKSTNLPPWKR